MALQSTLPLDSKYIFKITWETIFMTLRLVQIYLTEHNHKGKY